MTDNLLELVFYAGTEKLNKRNDPETVSPLSSGKKSPPVQSIECGELYNIQGRLSALFSPTGDPGRVVVTNHYPHRYVNRESTAPATGGPEGFSPPPSPMFYASAL
jgi:hypothetical protein